jgi:hypothetical protein
LLFDDYGDVTFIPAAIRIKLIIVDLYRAAMPRKSAHWGAPMLRKNAITSGWLQSMARLRGVLPMLQGGAWVANSIMIARRKRHCIALVFRSRVGFRWNQQLASFNASISGGEV